MSGIEVFAFRMTNAMDNAPTVVTLLIMLKERQGPSVSGGGDERHYCSPVKFLVRPTGREVPP